MKSLAAAVTSSLLAAVVLAPLVLTSPATHAAPPAPIALSVPTTQCAAAKAVFDSEWRIASDLTSPVADVCNATA